MNPAAWLRRLPPIRGAGFLVLLMALLLLGRLSGLCDLYEALGLRPEAVWRGEIWRLFTYALLPANLGDFILGAWALLWLGALLGRLWSPRECLLYGGICTVAAGAVVCLLFPRFPGLLGSSAIPVIGLIVAWGRLCGHERLLFAAGWETSGRNAALVWGAALVLAAWFTQGRWYALPHLLASAGAGWLYLSLRWRFLHRQAFRPAARQRMSHLEL